MNEYLPGGAQGYRVAGIIAAVLLSGLACVSTPHAGRAADPIIVGPLPEGAVSIIGTSGRPTLASLGGDYGKLLLPTLYLAQNDFKALMASDSPKDRRFYWWRGASSTSNAVRGAGNHCAEASGAPGTACVLFAEGSKPKADSEKYFTARTDFLNLGKDRARVVLGSENAPIAVVGFVSHTCPNCAEFMEKSFPKLKKDYIDKGQVRFILRDYVRGNYDFLPARLVHCTDPAKFYEATEAVYRTRKEWIAEKNEINEEKLRSVLAPFTKSPGDLDACAKNPDLDAQLAAQNAEAERLFSLIETPSFSVNGIMHHATIHWSIWEQILKAHLARKRG